MTGRRSLPPFVRVGEEFSDWFFAKVEFGFYSSLFSYQLESKSVGLFSTWTMCYSFTGTEVTDGITTFHLLDYKLDFFLRLMSSGSRFDSVCIVCLEFFV